MTEMEMEPVTERMLTVSQIVNLTGAAPQTVKDRIFNDRVPGALLDEDTDKVLVPQSAYEAALAAGVFEPIYKTRPRKPRITRVCANPDCGLTFLVIAEQAKKRGPYCSAECSARGARAGELSYADAGALIAELRGSDKPLSRERVSQYVRQGRLAEPLTETGVRAAYASGELDPRPGVRGRLIAPRGYMTTADFAEKTGLSTSVVGDMCARGDVRAKKDRGGYIISEAAYRAWMRTREQR